MSEHSTPSLHFSVVSGSNHELLFGCLDSLFASLPPSAGPVTITVTCNQPGSSLPARLLMRYPSLDIIENSVRRGFAANHNAVVRRTTADYLWIINDDLVFLPGAIERVTTFLEAPAQERVAAVSPRLLNPDRSLQPSTYSFPVMPQMFLGVTGLRETWLVNQLYRRLASILRRRPGGSRFWAHDRTVDTDTFRGACVAMRTTAVREVGPMVEVSLVGSEETEWHRRLQRHGWRVVFFAEAEVIHYGNQTIKTERRLAHEELKGTLYFFATDRAPLTFACFCASLVPAFAIQAAWRWFRKDREGRQLAVACLGTAWRSLWGDWPGRSMNREVATQSMGSIQ
jgi:GT2 family glycosyltransferase